MESPIQSWYTQKLTIVLFLFCISFSSVVEAITSSSKLDQPVVSQPTGSEIKCECGDQLPPPPLPPPPPPLLALPEYSSPQNCNPPPPPPPPHSPPPRTPPPPRFIYVTSVPWDEHSYSAAPNRVVELLVLAGLGAVSITMIFG